MARIFLTQLTNPAQTVTYENIAGLTVSESRTMDVRVVTPNTPGTYPVVFYSHGHSANPGTAGSTNARALADQGYIVVVPTHLDSTANPAVLRDAYPLENPASTLHRVADIKHAFDNLQQLMAPATGYVADASRPVMAGHSHGSWVTYLLTGAIPNDPAYTALPSGNPYGLTSLVDPRFVASILSSPQSISDVNAIGPGFGVNSWVDYRMPSLFISGTLDSTVLEPNFEARFDGFDLGPGEDKHAIVLNGLDHFDIGGLTATPSETNALAKVMDAFLDAYVRGQPNRIASPETLIGLDALITHAFVRDGGLSRGIIKGTDSNDSLTGHVTDDDVRGLGGHDVVTGAGGNDTLDGGAGNDTIVGGEGDDYLLGGDDNDQLFGGNGTDQIFGGHGDDYIQADGGPFSVLSGDGGNDTIYGGTGIDYMIGGAGNDVMVGLGGINSLYGGDGNDYMVSGDGPNNVLDGGAGANSLWGGGGSDYAVGGEGADIIVTAGGDDYLFGNAGNDAIYAGAGTDYIYSNAGNDFIYTDDFGFSFKDYVYVGPGTGIDTVVDFKPGQGADSDVIVMSATAARSLAAVQAAAQQVGVYTVIQVSTTDQLYLYNVSISQLTADNFIFL